MPIVTIRGTHEHASTGQRYPWRASYVVGVEGAHASIAVAIDGLRQPLRVQTRLRFDPLNTHAARAVNVCVNQLIDETDFGALAMTDSADAAGYRGDEGTEKAGTIETMAAIAPHKRREP